MTGLSDNKAVFLSNLLCSKLLDHLSAKSRPSTEHNIIDLGTNEEKYRLCEKRFWKENVASFFFIKKIEFVKTFLHINTKLILNNLKVALVDSS